MTEAAPADDAAVERVTHQLHVALARTRRDLLDAELAMLLGVPVPNGNQGRDLAADDPRLLRRETIAASLAEFARPTHVLDGYVDHARRQWQGSDRQRRAMRIVAGRAAEFLARCRRPIGPHTAADPAAVDVHGQVSMRLKEVADWASYLAQSARRCRIR